jgi:hypothetical protein
MSPDCARRAPPRVEKKVFPNRFFSWAVPQQVLGANPLASCLIPAKVCVRNGGAPDFFPARRVALPSGALLQFLFSVLTLRSLIRGSGVSRRGPSGAGERVARALTQERAAITLRRLQGRKTAAGRCLPEGRAVSPECKKSASESPRTQAEAGRTPTLPLRHSPGKRPLERQSVSAGRGLGAPSLQRVRVTPPAAPGASVPVLHAQCLRPTSQVRGELSTCPTMVLQSYV